MTTWILATLACVGVFAFGLYLSRKNPYRALPREAFRPPGNEGPFLLPP